MVNFNAGKTQLITLDHSNNSGATDVNMDRCVRDEQSSFQMLRSFFSLK